MKEKQRKAATVIQKGVRVKIARNVTNKLMTEKLEHKSARMIQKHFRVFKGDKEKATENATKESGLDPSAAASTPSPEEVSELLMRGHWSLLLPPPLPPLLLLILLLLLPHKDGNNHDNCGHCCCYEYSEPLPHYLIPSLVALNHLIGGLIDRHQRRGRRMLP